FLPQEEQERYLERTPLVALTRGTLIDRPALETALEATRGLGYAVSRAERDPWAASVAVPLFRAGTVIGSVSLCGPLDRFTADAVREHGRALATATRDELAPMIGR